MDGIAMALHFMIDDFDLRQDHKDRDDRTGRWPFALGGAAYAAQLVAAG
jgi:hypothetical protein